MEVRVTKCNNCPFKASNYHEYSIGNDTVVYCNLMTYLGIRKTYLDSYDSLEACEYCDEVFDEVTDDYDQSKCTCEEEPKIPIPDSCPIKNVDIKISTDD